MSEGFYWVQFDGAVNVVAEYDGEGWLVPGRGDLIAEKWCRVIAGPLPDPETAVDIAAASA